MKIHPMIPYAAGLLLSPGLVNLPSHVQEISFGLSVKPQLRYAPAFNDFHEFSAGANLHYYFIRSRAGQDTPKFAAYLLAGVHYNRGSTTCPAFTSWLKPTTSSRQPAWGWWREEMPSGYSLKQNIIYSSWGPPAKPACSFALLTARVN